MRRRGRRRVADRRGLGRQRLHEHPAPRARRGRCGPASWATSAKVRSSARKSGKRRVESASRTTPSTTSGKSWPLATICVPTSTPDSARLEALEDLEVAARRRARAVGVEAEDRQRRGRGGDLGLDPLAARRPARARVTEPQSGHAAAAARAWPQWWQRRSSPARWTTSETSQLGHPAAQPQRAAGQVAAPSRAG